MVIWGFSIFFLEKSNNKFKTSMKTVLTSYQERIFSESFERIGILVLHIYKYTISVLHVTWHLLAQSVGFEYTISDEDLLFLNQFSLDISENRSDTNFEYA